MVRQRSTNNSQGIVAEFVVENSTHVFQSKNKYIYKTTHDIRNIKKSITVLQEEFEYKIHVPGFQNRKLCDYNTRYGI